MAQAIISMRIMPESPDVDLDNIGAKVKGIIKKVAGEGEVKTEHEPVAFGLKSLNVIFVMDENKKLDDIENQISEMSDVNSVEVTDVRRAIG